MKNEIRKIEQNRNFRNKRINKTKNKKNVSLHSILYSQNLFVLVFILILFTLITNTYYNIIENQHLRSTKYIEINELSDEILETKIILSRYASSKIFTRKQELYIECESKISNIKDRLERLKISYEESPDLYFAYTGIANGITYIENEISNLQYYSFIEDSSFYKDYLKLDKVLSYLIDYSSKKYLTAQVVENSKLVDKEEKSLNRLKFFLFVIVLMVILIYLVVTNKIASILLKPIKIMMNAADNITHGKLDDKDIKLQGPSEYVFLEKSMNEMKYSLINRMELMRENSELEKVLSEKKLQEVKIKHDLEVARFSSLQSQINPHFFFNTLNTLKMMCLFENANKSVEFVSNFASFFRYTLKHTDRVTIKEELNFVERYLKLQKARFFDRMRFVFEVDSTCSDIEIPPLIIQPLVENSIKHGLEKKEEGGEIKVVVERENNRIFIKVIDDGVGVGENINLSMENGFDNCHIGLKNIQQRLSLFFNNKADLNLKRLENNGGTQATISIPFLRGNNV